MTSWFTVEACPFCSGTGEDCENCGYTGEVRVYPVKDDVNEPSHYTAGTIECIDYLRDTMSSEAFKGFLEGNTKKYLHRWRHKGSALKDLQKAQWYLNELVKEVGYDGTCPESIREAKVTTKYDYQDEDWKDK